MSVLTKARQSLIDQDMCLMDHNAKSHSRGLCQRCLEAARDGIQRGDTSEEKLIAEGLMLPVKKRGRKSKNPLAKLIAQQKSKGKGK